MRKLLMFITGVCVLLLIKRKVADELKEDLDNKYKVFVTVCLLATSNIPKVLYFGSFMKVCRLEFTKDNGKA